MGCVSSMSDTAQEHRWRNVLCRNSFTECYEKNWMLLNNACVE